MFGVTLMKSRFMKLFSKEKTQTGQFKKAILDLTEEESIIIEQCVPYTMTSKERMLGLIRAIQYVNQNEIAGDFVECGVWKGGSAMIMGHLCHKLKMDRKIYLFDTFSGMTEPTSTDIDKSGRTAQELMEKQDKSNSLVWAISNKKEVSENLKQCEYENFALVEGDVAKTLFDSNNIPEKVSILRLDTDWYESTIIELEILYPRLVKGGVLIIDDYGHWQGAKKAVDEYFSNMAFTPFMNRLDYTGRLIIKP
jgi:O-methyltransferase